MDDDFGAKKGLPKSIEKEFTDVKKGLPPPIDKTKKEVSQELQSLIERIPSEVPDNFRDEATRVAEWITDLDIGNRGLLNDSGVVNWLGDIGKRDGFRPFIDSEKLPWWLKEDVMNEIRKEMFIASPIDEDRVTRLAEKFKECGVKSGWKNELIDGVLYYVFGNGGQASEPDGFKIYLNSEHLEEAMDSGKFEEVINELQQTSDCPSSMKYLDDGVVIYFRQVGQDPTATRKIFLDKGVNVSAPAQDVYHIVERDNHLEMTSFIKSNDSAFVVTIPNNEYNRATFFKKYLEDCLECGKKPDEPNLTSFIYALTNNDEFKPQARELTELPICFSSRVFSSLD